VFAKEKCDENKMHENKESEKIEKLRVGTNCVNSP
jgi:hypothetical protein